MNTATRWLIASEWRSTPGRTLLTALVIAIGVALGFAVHLINASALNEFARAIRTVNGNADLQVHATSTRGFNEELYGRLARLEGVADASPVVEVTARLAGARGPITLLGIDMLRAANVTPSLIGRSASGGAAGLAADSIFLSQAARDAAAASAGENIALEAAGKSADFHIAGTLPGVTDEQRIAVADIATVQWRLGQLGRLQRVDLRFAPGADPARMAAAVQAMLPPDAEIVSRETEARRSDALSRAYRVNLDMLALMALLSGGFLVYSAQSLSVARRRPHFALTRVLGVTRRALLLQVLIEGGAVGTVGALAGLGLGLILAKLALRLLGGDLGGGYFYGTQPELIFAPGAAAVFFVLGLAAALAGSFLPAREAARAQPAVALKNLGDAVDPARRPPILVPLILLTMGAGFALLPALGDLPLFGYLSIGLMLAGGVAAMPLLARLLLAPLQRRAFRNPATNLSVKRLWGAPGEAAIALCGIVASMSLVVAMAVMVTSFRGSVDDWLQEILPADIYLHMEGGDSAGLTPAQQQRLTRVADVEDILFYKQTPLRLSPDLPPVILIPDRLDAADSGRRLALLSPPLATPRGATPIYISEAAGQLYRKRPGDEVVLPLGDAHASRFFVAGIWRDYARQHGAIALPSEVYTRLTGDALRTDAAVRLAPGANAGQVIAALREAMPQDVSRRMEFGMPGEIRRQALRVFDRSFAVTYLLEAIAILVGLAGVAASFSAQTLARTKEFGMLRHVGVLRRQITAMVAGEGLLLGGVGVVAGLALGIAISQVLIHVVNPQSFHWTMQTRLPLALFAGVSAALIAAAALTALLAGRRALSAEAVRAVREDW
jgi:putative ABC transport system permease protein